MLPATEPTIGVEDEGKSPRSTYLVTLSCVLNVVVATLGELALVDLTREHVGHAIVEECGSCRRTRSASSRLVEHALIRFFVGSLKIVDCWR